MQNTPKTPPEPNYQDELDVYEAVLKLEEKYGKKFLTDEQRVKLEKAGRISQQKDESVELKKPGTIIGLEESAALIMEGLWLDAENEVAKIYPKDLWVEMDQASKRRIGFAKFINMYGVSPDTFRNEVIKKVTAKRLYG